MTAQALAIDLASGDLRVRVAPDLGAAVLWFRSVGGAGIRDWMRPMPAQGGAILDTACFPLVPFSNRIEGARFAYGGRDVRVPANWPGGMAIHGIGWQRAWQVADQSADRLSLVLEPGREDWPWTIRVGLQYRLRPSGLTMAFSLQNLSGAAMPAGLGFHPYFPRQAQTRLTADCGAVLLTDDRQLPCALDPANPVAAGLRAGALPADSFDNCLTGWRGPAVIDWGDGAAMTISARPTGEYAILYAPHGAGFFCFEPVTHIPNAHNARDGRFGPDGLVDLAGGAVQEFAVDFDVRIRTGAG